MLVHHLPHKHALRTPKSSESRVRGGVGLGHVPPYSHTRHVAAVEHVEHRPVHDWLGQIVGVPGIEGQIHINGEQPLGRLAHRQLVGTYAGVSLPGARHIIVPFQLEAHRALQLMGGYCCHACDNIRAALLASESTPKSLGGHVDLVHGHAGGFRDHVLGFGDILGAAGNVQLALLVLHSARVGLKVELLLASHKSLTLNHQGVLGLDLGEDGVNVGAPLLPNSVHQGLRLVKQGLEKGLLLHGIMQSHDWLQLLVCDIDLAHRQPGSILALSHNASHDLPNRGDGVGHKDLVVMGDGPDLVNPLHILCGHQVNEALNAASERVVDAHDLGVGHSGQNGLNPALPPAPGGVIYVLGLPAHLERGALVLLAAARHLLAVVSRGRGPGVLQAASRRPGVVQGVVLNACGEGKLDLWG
mmetsp:Transcript_28331/g.60333  ORF Transcript_28331/g.60333 Transcript_28331/m.60333 type:complete len:415 (-) Transcript_28331:103-1347(-)